MERRTLTNAATNALVERLTRLLEPVVLDCGFELVELQFRRESRGWVLRLIVDSDQGVRLDDCVAISREAGYLLEVEDPIDHPYHLEVSSPGLDRPLVTARDFRRVVGKKVSMTLREPLDGRERLQGVVSGVEGEAVRLDTGQGEVAVALAQVAKARLVLEV